MTSVTNYLKEKDMSLREQGEPSNANYTCFNTGGVETEIGEFLYGLVRMYKPENVFETGTHLGIASSYMGLALKHNDHGYLTTVEISKQNIIASRDRWKRIGIEKRILCDKENSTEYFLEYDCELMFLDSEPDIRYKEFIRFYPRLKPGGMILIHDTPRNFSQGVVNTDHPDYKHWPFGKLPKQILDWVKSGELSVTNFPNPRGMSAFYKRHEGDYNFFK